MLADAERVEHDEDDEREDEVEEWGDDIGSDIGRRTVFRLRCDEDGHPDDVPNEVKDGTN